MASAVSLTLGTQERGDRQGQDQRGEGEHGVHEAHDHAVHRPRKKPAMSPRGMAITAATADDLEGRPQRRPATPDQAAQDVPAEVVGAEPVGERGAGVDQVEVLGVGVVGRDERGEDRRHDHDEEEDETPDGEALLAEAVPEAGSLAAHVGDLRRLVDRRGDSARPTKGSSRSGGRARLIPGGPSGSRSRR